MYVLVYICRMARRYSIVDARSHLPAIIDDAESGLEIELTRRGRPVAVVVSSREFARLRGRQRHFRDVYRQFLARYPLLEVGVDHKFAASTRDRSAGRDVTL